jgi:hypothetical protein
MTYPTTLEEARQMRYGTVYVKLCYREGYCAHDTWLKHTLGGWQCCRPNGHGPGGLYCRQHARMIEKALAMKAEGL